MLNNYISSNGGIGIQLQENCGSTSVTYCDIFNNVPNIGGLTVPEGLGDITTTNAKNTPCDQFYNIFDDPLFVDPDNDNYHLIAGSRCIDAGDPTSEFSSEPDPNGGCINMGAYGNTEEATVSQVTLEIPRDNYVMMGIPVVVPDGGGAPFTLFADNFDNLMPTGTNWRVST